MPEAPDLVVIKEFLAERIVGQEIVSARVLKPSVVRSLAGDFQDDIQGKDGRCRGPAREVAHIQAVRCTKDAHQSDAYERAPVLRSAREGVQADLRRAVTCQRLGPSVRRR